MNESTAKTKWCPFAIGQGIPVTRTLFGATNGQTVAVSSINRALGGAAQSDCMCLADGCMAWVVNQSSPPGGFCSLMDDNAQE